MRFALTLALLLTLTSFPAAADSVNLTCVGETTFGTMTFPGKPILSIDFAAKTATVEAWPPVRMYDNEYMVVFFGPTEIDSELRGKFNRLTGTASIDTRTRYGNYEFRGQCVPAKRLF